MPPLGLPDDNFDAARRPRYKVPPRIHARARLFFSSLATADDAAFSSIFSTKRAMTPRRPMHAFHHHRFSASADDITSTVPFNSIMPTSPTYSAHVARRTMSSEVSRHCACAIPATSSKRLLARRRWRDAQVGAVAARIMAASSPFIFASRFDWHARAFSLMQYCCSLCLLLQSRLPLEPLKDIVLLR